MDAYLTPVHAFASGLVEALLFLTLSSSGRSESRRHEDVDSFQATI